MTHAETIKARRAANDARIHSHSEETVVRFLRMLGDLSETDQDMAEDVIRQHLDRREGDQMKS